MATPVVMVVRQQVRLPSQAQFQVVTEAHTVRAATVTTRTLVSGVQAPTRVVQASVRVLAWARGYRQEKLLVGDDYESAVELVEPLVVQEESPQEVPVVAISAHHLSLMIMMTTRDALQALREEATAILQEVGLRFHRVVVPVPEYPELHPPVAMEASTAAQEGLVVLEFMEIQGCQELVQAYLMMTKAAEVVVPGGRLQGCPDLHGAALDWRGLDLVFGVA